MDDEEIVGLYITPWVYITIICKPMAIIDKWEQEHMELLERIAPAEFNILHYGAIAELKKK